jgi:hypothetical protein
VWILVSDIRKGRQSVCEQGADKNIWI